MLQFYEILVLKVLSHSATHEATPIYHVYY